ncbi:hypothetical protein J6590_009351 [Homalodisca vitripennis]|nr:hypothetical protein J6590_009351 [Homalodisca vitripennis]
MADDSIKQKEGSVKENMIMKTDKKPENLSGDKPSGDNEDSESLEEQPLDIGEHYLVRRSDDSWPYNKTFNNKRASHVQPSVTGTLTRTLTWHAGMPMAWSQVT